MIKVETLHRDTVLINPNFVVSVEAVRSSSTNYLAIRLTTGQTVCTYMTLGEWEQALAREGGK